MSRRKPIVSAVALLCAIGFVNASAQAQSVEEFYKGKHIDFIVSTGVGAPYDVWARTIGRHMGNHIPGNPTFITKNMPGGGHTIAANYLFNEAAHDGSAVGMFARTMPTQEVLGNPSVRFKTASFNFLGGSEASSRVCVIDPRSPTKSVDDMFQRETIFGGSGAGSSGVTTPTLVSKLLGLKAKIVSGYTSNPDVFLAMDRGEVEAVCQNLDGVESNRPGALDQGKVKLLFNLEKKPVSTPTYSGPSILQFTKTEEQRQILAFYNSNSDLGWPMATTPGVPKDRLDTLRSAFDATMKDPEFLADAQKTGLKVTPMKAQDLTAIAKAIAATPKAIIDKTIEIVGSMSE
jgi:tripartite-type tricarboxylate transporter receptor subunit TctC